MSAGHDYVGDAWLRLRVFALDAQKDFDAAVAPMRTKLDNFGKSAMKVGASLTKMVSVPVAAGFGASVKVAADFEKVLINAASVANATTEEFKIMTDVAKELGDKTVFSATEAGEAMYYLASAGVEAGEMASVLEPTLALAAATQTDLAQTTDAVVASLNQYGLEADETARVSNVFAAAVSASQATMDKLASSMRYVGPIANAVGYSIEETTGTLMALYDAGFKGEQAGTIMRQALSALLAPSKSASDALTALGLSARDVSPELHSMAEIIDVLREKGITTEQVMSIFGQEAGPGIASLLQVGGNALVQYTDQVTGTQRAVEMAEQQAQSFSNQMKMLKDKLGNAAIEIGNNVIPVLKDLADNVLTPLVDKFNKATPETQAFITKVGLIAAAVGPATIALGALASAVSTLIGGVGSLIGVIKKIPLLLSPGGLVLMAIGALIAALAHFYTQSEEARESIRDTYSVMGDRHMMDGILAQAEAIDEQAAATERLAAARRQLENSSWDYDETSWRNQQLNEQAAGSDTSAGANPYTPPDIPTPDPTPTPTSVYTPTDEPYNPFDTTLYGRIGTASGLNASAGAIDWSQNTDLPDELDTTGDNFLSGIQGILSTFGVEMDEDVSRALSIAQQLFGQGGTLENIFGENTDNLLAGLGEFGTGLMNGLGNILSSIGSGIGGFLGGIFGFAEGAYVKHRPGGVLARIGEGSEDEVVAPLSKLEKMAGSGDSGPVSVNVTMNVNAMDAPSFVDMIRNNRSVVETIVVENVYRNGQIRKAMGAT